MTYPDGIDALVNVNATDSLAAGGHAARHNSVNTALVEIKNMLGPSPAGKIMQIVRATDGTTRTTTSTSFVDASISVTITPQTNTSAVILIWSANIYVNPTNGYLLPQITDNSNNAISGAEGSFVGSSLLGDFATLTTLVGYATPATTSAVTYKGRFRVNAGTVTGALLNVTHTGQLYAIEVSA
jgi:hypothetical protein